MISWKSRLSKVGKSVTFPKYVPTAVDLFSGCGGLTYGLTAAGFKVIGAIEIDPVAAETYKLNHRNIPISCADIRKVDPRVWARGLSLVTGNLDLLAGCPPCQGFSSLRTRNGSKQNRDAKNSLLLEMLRFIEVLLPKSVLMENVPGLEGRVVLTKFKRALRVLGYTVSTTVEDVRYFGVPQRRKRLILIAFRGEAVIFARRLNSIRTVRDAIGTLPDAGNSGDVLHDFMENRTLLTKRRIACIPKNGGGRLSLPESEQLECHRKTNGYKDTYGRMAWDQVAPTITTGCFNPSKGRFLHPEHNRCITMREAALLQSFPLEFSVPQGTAKTQVAKMLGNALPPEFIRHHAIELRKALFELSVRPI